MLNTIYQCITKMNLYMYINILTLLRVYMKSIPVVMAGPNKTTNIFTDLDINLYEQP